MYRSSITALYIRGHSSSSSCRSTCSALEIIPTHFRIIITTTIRHFDLRFQLDSVPSSSSVPYSLLYLYPPSHHQGIPRTMRNNRGNSPLHLRRQIETLVVLFLVGLVGIKRERLEEEMESRWTNSNAASSPESQIIFDSRIWENTRHNRPLSTHSLTKAGF